MKTKKEIIKAIVKHQNKLYKSNSNFSTKKAELTLLKTPYVKLKMYYDLIQNI